MSNLINDNDTLKKYVPNTLKAVAGELSLSTKYSITFTGGAMAYRHFRIVRHDESHPHVL